MSIKFNPLLPTVLQTRFGVIEGLSGFPIFQMTGCSHDQIHAYRNSCADYPETAVTGYFGVGPRAESRSSRAGHFACPARAAAPINALGNAERASP